MNVVIFHSSAVQAIRAELWKWKDTWRGKAGETPPLIFKGQGRVVGPYPFWDSVSGSPVRCRVWSIPYPNIFGSGAVRSSAVFRRTGPMMFYSGRDR